MGCFNITCSISGLPIVYGQQLVGFPVQQSRFKGSFDFKYVPSGWPIFGPYDDYGRIEGQKNNETQSFSYVLREIWDVAEQYFHYRNNQEYIKIINVEEILQKFKEEKKYRQYFPEKNWTDKDLLSYVFYFYLNNYSKSTDYQIIFNNLLHNEPTTARQEIKKHDCLVARGPFKDLILDKIINKTWSDDDELILKKLLSLYSGQWIIGRNIMPSGCVEQGPKFKQRVKILKFHLSLAQKLKKAQEKSLDEA